MTPGDEEQLTSYRLGALEAAVKELSQEMKGGFASLSYVHKEVYESEKKTAADYAQETRKIAEQARTVALGTVSLVIAGFGLVLALIKALAK